MKTFNEIARIHLFMSNENESDWHQHSNGGGWVQNTATVDETVFVGRQAVIQGCAQIRDGASVFHKARVMDNACVYENATLSGCVNVVNQARVYGNAEICEHAMVSGQAQINGHARVGDNSIISENAKISDNAAVFDRAIIRGNAHVLGGAQIGHDAYVLSGTWKNSALSFFGTKGIVRHVAPKVIKIGCIELPISQWLEEYKEIGQEKGYSSEEIAEYKDYIDLLALRDKQLFGRENV